MAEFLSSKTSDSWSYNSSVLLWNFIPSFTHSQSPCGDCILDPGLNTGNGEMRLTLCSYTAHNLLKEDRHVNLKDSNTRILGTVMERHDRCGRKKSYGAEWDNFTVLAGSIHIEYHVISAPWKARVQISRGKIFSGFSSFVSKVSFTFLLEL